MQYVLAYDIGTTGMKTCLFQIADTISLVSSASSEYDLFILPDGGAEQDPAQWWEAMAITTAELLTKTQLNPAEIAGISFSSQMQGVVLVDENGNALRRAMSYLDQRASAELQAGIAHGLQIAGANVRKLLPSLRITGAVSSSVKDPLWKYKWVEAHEPEVFARTYKWLDVKEYIIGRCTGHLIMTEDSAYATFLYDSRPGKKTWSEKLCRLFGVNPQHLAPIVAVHDQVGTLTQEAAGHLGLPTGTPVFGGGGDASMIGIGSGCVETGDTHIYMGTSGWVSTIVDRQMVDTKFMIAAIVGAIPEKYNYFAEMETAGKALEWVKNTLAPDEVGDQYQHLDETLAAVPPGAGGVLFAPWLHGNRCPFEDPRSTGLFLGVTLDTGKPELVRAVVEGVCYHLRWMLACQDRKIRTSDPIRFSGGGALSDAVSQILADITGRTIQVVESPQNVGAVGAAVTCAMGLGLTPSLSAIKGLVPVAKTFQPDSARHRQYVPHYDVFQQLYRTNRKLFAAMPAPQAK